MPARSVFTVTEEGMHGASCVENVCIAALGGQSCIVQTPAYAVSVSWRLQL